MKGRILRRMPIRRNSILLRLLIPMLLVMLLQAFIFIGSILWGGTVKSLSSNAFAILNERVINRKNYIESDMVNRWSNVSETVESVCSLAEQKNGAQLMEDMDFADEMIDLLRRNTVTGVFAVLNEQFSHNGSAMNYGFYVRDNDPNSNPANRSDLQVEIATSKLMFILQNAGIPTSNWDVGFQPESLTDFYSKPFQAAHTFPDAAYKDLGYWSRSFYFTNSDRKIITYTVPLIRNGSPFGVLGVELTMEYVKKSLPYSEIGEDNNSAYALAVRNRGEENYTRVTSNGALYTMLLEDQNDIAFTGAEQYGQSSYRIGNAKNGEKAYGTVQQLKLYNTNTPFEGEEWFLIGILPQQSLFRFSRNVTATMTIAVTVSVILGLAVIVCVSILLTRPIMKQAEQLKKTSASGHMELNKVNIYEIDELIGAIQTLSDNMARSVTRLSTIINLTQMPLGAFEYDGTTQKVLTTDKFFDIIGSREQIPTETGGEEFGRIMKELDSHLEEISDDKSVRVYNLITEDGFAKWVKMKVIEDGARILGVVQDITAETIEKRKIEHERDYDILTNLLNRRAFLSELMKLFSEPAQLGVAALILMDLDNLKHINDTYGHDLGDEYLRLAASALQKNAPVHSVVARMAGDEFYVFLYGFESREEGSKAVLNITEGLKSSSLRLPDGSYIRMRATGGVAWYPEHATSMDELLQYADFAMYEVKHRIKGEFKDFDPAKYSQNSYLLYNKEDLNDLIEKELVEYYFQPIVDVTNGMVFGYEALMRSLVPTLKSPQEVMALARSQFKLNQIERLTWFKAMETYASMAEQFAGRRIFINSISNQILSDEDILLFQEKFRDYLDRIIMEFTEDEKQNSLFTDKKQQFIESWGGGIALDDFGSGYNGENFLLSLKPDFLKIDMAIVRNIDRDDNRKTLLRNIVSYAGARNIKVIAEGAETRDEVKELIACGVNYLQGFYTGAPAARPQTPSWSVRRDIAAMYQSYRGKNGEGR